MAVKMKDKRFKTKCDSTMNANSEIVTHQDDDSDFEIEITNDFCSDRVNVHIVPKQNVIEFRETANSPDTSEHKEAAVNETDITDSVHETGIHKKDGVPCCRSQTENIRSCTKSLSVEESKNDEAELYGGLDDLDIDIVYGKCPGTIDINIVTIDAEVLAQFENTTIANIICTEKTDNDKGTGKGVNISDQPMETVNESPATIKADEGSLKDGNSEKVDAAACCKMSMADPVTMKSNEINRHTRKEKEIVILSRKAPNKSRKSQSSPCLADSIKASSADSSKFQEDAVNEHDTSHHVNVSKPQPKRNQEPSDHTGKMKRFKGMSNLMVVKRQSAAERGDFTDSSIDEESAQKRSILDDVDNAIPRVIPRSGKQVKFRDEITGSTLIQPSPEKRCPSEEPSPDKAEKSILKKDTSSDENCIEPQVFYNSSYVDDDSDGRDSGLVEDEDYRPWEYRDNRYRGYECFDYKSVSSDNVSETNSYYNRQYDAQPHYPVDDRGYGTPRSPRYFQNQRSYSDPQAVDFSGRQADRVPQIPRECNRDIYEEYYPRDRQYVRRSPGSYPWATQTEVYTREKQYCLPTFDTNAFSNNKTATGPKKTNPNKKPRRDKKKQRKKRGKAETDIEKCQRFLSAGQVRLASRGNFDVRRIGLEYLLHIGDFSMKYKTEPGPLESMTLTVYNGAEGTSVDVRHMLQMHSNFINRLRFCLQRGKEIWLLHKFLPLGALQVLMNRDPYREVLGELHAQFITAGLLIGVNYLHQNGITHGNLYPWKVLINDRGYPVLTGFLPLLDSDDPVTSDLRERRRYIFSVPYAAPDRFIGDMQPGVDIFSIGCIAYEIVVGRTPFYGGSEERTKEYILSYCYRPVYEYDTFSFAGEMFIESCLRKPSAHRFVPGRHLSNLYNEEWFSTLDLRRYEDQTLDSPILDVVQLLHKGDTLDLEERNLDYNWGRVMDIVSPHTPTLVC